MTYYVDRPWSLLSLAAVGARYCWFGVFLRRDSYESVNNNLGISGSIVDKNISESQEVTLYVCMCTS